MAVNFLCLTTLILQLSEQVEKDYNLGQKWSMTTTLTFVLSKYSEITSKLHSSESYAFVLCCC